MFKSSSKIFFGLLVFIVLALFAPAVLGAYEKFSPTEQVTISEFVSKDDYSAFTGDCTLTVYKPGGAAFTLEPFNGSGQVVMSKDSPDTGRRWVTFSTDGTIGIWPAIISCQTVGQDDMTRLDKTFSVGYVGTSNTDIASSVWGYTGSALDATSNAVSKIWSFSGRGLDVFNNIVEGMWSYTGSTLSTAGNAISKVWSYTGDRLLTGSGLTTGNLVTEAYLENPASSIISKIDAKASQVSLNALPATIVAGVWDRALTDITVADSIGRLLKDNINATISSRSSHSAKDVWDVLTSALVLDDSIGKQLKINVDTTISSRASQETLDALNDISAASVWDYAVADASVSGSLGKLLKDNINASISSRSSHTAADVWTTAGRTLTSNANFNDPTAAAIATAVWGESVKELSSYGNDITAQDVWNVLSATITTADSIGKQVKDNLDVAVSTRSSLSNQEAGWTVTMSDFGQAQAGQVYRAKLQILNYKSTPTDPAVAPVWTLYDGNHVEINPSNYVITKDSDGTYHVSYTIGATIVGVCETEVSVEVESGKVIKVNDYWEVYQGSPAQVKVNEITDVSIPKVSANITITNEGLNWYEYHYEWCVVLHSSDTCGGDNAFYGHNYASKEIDGKTSYNTNLESDNLPSAGNYYFKLMVYYGTEQSGAFKSFVATGEPAPICGNNIKESGEQCDGADLAGASCLSKGYSGGSLSCAGSCIFNISACTSNGGGGGGGGGGGEPPASSSAPTICDGADFNHDKKVNSTDFSILLAFWKTPFPFKNSCVDINKDGKVNSVDFSILMYQWGTKK